MNGFFDEKKILFFFENLIIFLNFGKNERRSKNGFLLLYKFEYD